MGHFQYQHGGRKRRCRLRSGRDVGHGSLSLLPVIDRVAERRRRALVDNTGHGTPSYYPAQSDWGSPASGITPSLRDAGEGRPGCCRPKPERRGNRNTPVLRP
jgi:hypothetical protein